MALHEDPSSLPPAEGGFFRQVAGRIGKISAHISGPFRHVLGVLLQPDPVWTYLTRTELSVLREGVDSMYIDSGGKFAKIDLVDAVLIERPWYRDLRQRDPSMAERARQAVIEHTNALPYLT